MKALILVVEDDEASRTLMEVWLQTEGYHVETAADLQEALAALRRCPPAAVLLDVGLGGEDGLEVARWMRSQPDSQHVPILAVSAHAMLTERDAMMRAGCNDYLPKPVDFAVLQKKLHYWLHHSAPGRPAQSRTRVHQEEPRP